MLSKVRVKTVTPQRFVAIRARTTPFEIGARMADLLERVWAHLARQEHVTVGPPIARYHAFDEREIDVEVGFPVAELVPTEGPIQIGDLPGGPAATVLVTGPYVQLPEAYDAIRQWMRENGRVAEGAPWDIYWVDSSHVTTADELRTEVVWPLVPQPADRR